MIWVYLLLVVVWMPICAWKAYRKGYQPLVWLVGGDIVAAVAILWLLPTARSGSFPLNKELSMRRTGNLFGLAFLVFNVVVTVYVFS